jgi:carbonic anhydrase/acetyltransferase-like protein (isoleucine patch superfamily)
MNWRRVFVYHPRKQTKIFLGLIRGAAWRLRGRSHGWPIVQWGVVSRCRFGRIRLGHFTRLATGVCLEAIGESLEEPARITIGDFTRVGEGTRIHARRGVTIGSHCAISWNCTIADLGMPEVEANAESKDLPASPIVIEDHVWIGCNVRVLGGVTIGTGAVVSAGSVVTSDVPPATLVAGNPARPIRVVGRWK